MLRIEPPGTYQILKRRLVENRKSGCFCWSKTMYLKPKINTIKNQYVCLDLRIVDEYFDWFSFLYVTIFCFEVNSVKLASCIFGVWLSSIDSWQLLAMYQEELWQLLRVATNWYMEAVSKLWKKGWYEESLEIHLRLYTLYINKQTAVMLWKFPFPKKNKTNAGWIWRSSIHRTLGQRWVWRGGRGHETSFCPKDFQLMVWGPVIYERDRWGTPAIPNHRAPNHQLKPL